MCSSPAFKKDSVFYNIPTSPVQNLYSSNIFNKSPSMAPSISSGHSNTSSDYFHSFQNIHGHHLEYDQTSDSKPVMSKNSIFDTNHIISKPAISMNDQELSLLRSGCAPSHPTEIVPPRVIRSLSVKSTMSVSSSSPPSFLNGPTILKVDEGSVLQNSENCPLENAAVISNDSLSGSDSKHCNKSDSKQCNQSDSSLYDDSLDAVPNTSSINLTSNSTSILPNNSKLQNIYPEMITVPISLPDLQSRTRNFSKNQTLIDTAFFQAANTSSRRTFVELDDDGLPLDAVSSITNSIKHFDEFNPYNTQSEHNSQFLVSHRLYSESSPTKYDNEIMKYGDSNSIDQKPPYNISQSSNSGQNTQDSINSIPPGVKLGTATYIPIRKNFLGEGQYAQVFAGTFFTRTGKIVPCAVKRMNKTKEAQVTGLCEVFILSLLQKYPQIVKLIDVSDEASMDSSRVHDFLFGQTDSPLNLLNRLTSFISEENSPRLLIVLEYCPKGSMWDFCMKNKHLIGRRLWIKWARQIAIAIRDIHSEGIVHHDIKPHNILLGEHLDCKLADFGNACMVPESGFSYSTKGKLFDFVSHNLHNDERLNALVESAKYSLENSKVPMDVDHSVENANNTYESPKYISEINFNSCLPVSSDNKSGPNIRIDTTSCFDPSYKLEIELTNDELKLNSATRDYSTKSTASSQYPDQLLRSPISPGTPTSPNSQDLPHSVALGRGTQGFAAPELVSTDSGMYSFPVDIYSVGATLWSLLSLHLPFALGRNGVQLIQAAKRGFFESGLQYGVHSGLDCTEAELKYGSGEPVQRPELEIIKRCVTLKPHQRCTAIELLDMIDKISSIP